MRTTGVPLPAIVAFEAGGGTMEQLTHRFRTGSSGYFCSTPDDFCRTTAMNVGFVLTGVVFALIGFDVGRRPAYHAERLGGYSLFTGGNAGSQRLTRALGVFLAIVGVILFVGGVTI